MTHRNIELQIQLGFWIGVCPVPWAVISIRKTLFLPLKKMNEWLVPMFCLYQQQKWSSCLANKRIVSSMLVTFDLDLNVTRSSFHVKFLILLKPPGGNIFVVTAHEYLQKLYNMFLFSLPGLKYKNRTLVTGHLKLFEMVESCWHIKYLLCDLLVLGSAMGTDAGRKTTSPHV